MSGGEGWTGFEQGAPARGCHRAVYATRQCFYRAKTLILFMLVARELQIMGLAALDIRCLLIGLSQRGERRAACHRRR